MQRNAGPPFRYHAPLGVAMPHTDHLHILMARPPDPENIRTEGSISRASAPTSVWLHRLRRWRWTVTRYRRADTPVPGLDGRIHLIADSGYTFTRLGAQLAAGRKLVRRDRA